VLLGNFTFDADQTVGAGQDNYVLTYDNGTGLISLEASAGGASALNDLTDVTITSATQGDILYRNATEWVNLGAGTSGQFLQTQGAGANPQWSSPSGSGDVVGPASATDNAVARFDSTTGKLIQNSGFLIDDSNNVTGAGNIGLSGGLNDANGNEIIKTTQTASAVNEITVTNNTTTNAPIISATGDDTNISLDINAKGTGNISLGNMTFDADQTIGAGQDNYVLTYDNGTGLISLEASAGGGGGLTDVVDDTTPQLGGNLDVNGNKIVSVSNGDIDIEPDGTGNVLLGNFTFDADQTVGAGQDNYVLTYDNGTGLISLEASAGGGGADADAIHDNVANEITAITEKTSVSALDEYIQEDSDASFVKKSIKHKTLRQAVPQTQTGTTYTLAIDDLDLTMNNASANTVTIPTNASVAFPVNTVISVIQLGAGSTTLTGDTGVTVNGSSGGSVEIGQQYGGAVLLKTASDTWVATVGASGSGDVTGPASATDTRIATFNGTTGKIIQDGGSTIADVQSRANHTGTQTASTISDFDTEVSNNTDVVANTAKVSNATHTGDVTGSTVLTIANNVVTDEKLDNMVEARIKGRALSAGSGDPQNLSASQVRAIINVEDNSQENDYQFLGTSGSISSSASVEFTTAGWFDGTYKELIFKFIDILPANDGANIYVRGSTDGGSTYLNTNEYDYANFGRGQSGNVSSNGASASFIRLNAGANGIGNASNEGFGGELSLLNPSTSTYKRVLNLSNQKDSAGDFNYQSGGGLILTTSSVNAIQFLMSSGNISSGEILVYGVRI